MVHGKNTLLSELTVDVKFLEQCQNAKKKDARFLKGVSISEQKKRVNNVLRAGTSIINIAKKVKKSLEAREKRIWGDMQWMNEDDKERADQVYAEKNAIKKQRLAKKEQELKKLDEE